VRFSLDTIHREDCIRALGEIPEGSVDLVFADPPFNIGYDYDVYDDRKDADSYLEWSRQWMSGVQRALKSNGTFWLAIGDEFAAELKVLATRDLGFHCRSWVIWYYTFGVNCKKKFSRSHAHLFHFVKDPKSFTFNRSAIAVPSARAMVYSDSRANPDGRVPDDTWILRPQDCVNGFSRGFSPDDDTWYFPRVAGTFKQRAGFHGCQMPEQLLGRIIKVCSNDGETILDPFSGSATTLAVAKKLGRHFIGFDISDVYIRHGRKRLESIECGDPLEGDPEPLASAPPTYGVALQPEKSVQRHRSRRSETAEERAIMAAFRETHDGYSVDRVVADPDLNTTFLEECRSRGIEGTDADLNRTLFRIRKQGRLLQIPTSKRTTFGWELFDDYIDASEIALSQMFSSDCPTLDEILVDPARASEFDKIAREFVPGFTSLQYRWAALKLRKAACQARARSRSVDVLTLSNQCPIEELLDRGVASGPGVYLLYSGKRRIVFAGDALKMSTRLQDRFGDPKRARAWRSEFADADIRISYAQVTPGQGVKVDGMKIQLLAHKVREMTDRESRPKWNWNQLLHA
jgi:DNA modification methylase